ncbi:phage integrase Arm DNA-binding domain-containing protein [Marinobacter sp. G11]|uniref:phage integrase Arm DNA-binding domain-containing protein n=1 Tax=Marinobacter sp. G11 TaxID=2903522 RepID=UPI001E41F4A4|nr:phage integrase Arm DNA-binding domain-containing protein [Marinobacter sp. G11]MCE0760717.1 phage integrase Arm DNA-binding domain-containing protein [Marinobacter sp. G11]
MAPRRRLKRNKDLAQNLYASVKNGVTYYQYRHPGTGQYHAMGNNKAEAQAAARQLNSILIKEADLVGGVLGTAGKDINHLITRYQEELLPSKRLAPGTQKILEYRLNRISRDIGNKQIDEVDVQAIAKYLDDSFERDAYIKHRATLIDLFRFAIMKGLYPADIGNPAEITYAKSDYEKARRRLTLEQFWEIHAKAEPWMQLAMEIALITLQGRAEVINMKFADYHNQTLQVIRQKSSKHEHSHLMIHCPQLEEIITRARQSNVPSPYIIHRRPVRKVEAEGRDHWTKLTPNTFTAEFRKTRDKCESFKKMPREARPTFHEIRALGSWLYKKQGYDTETYIQPLMAHADQKMTEHYQQGHEREWVRVEAGLSIARSKN